MSSADDLRPIGGHTNNDLRPIGGSFSSPSSGAAAASNNDLSSLRSVGQGASVPGAAVGVPSAAGSTVFTPRSAPAPRTAPAVEEAPRGPNKALMIAGGVAVVLMIVAFFLFRPPAPVPAPTSFAAFTAADLSFACQVPEGWDRRAGGAAGNDKQTLSEDGVFLRSGNARIEVTTNTVASLIKSQLMFGNSIVPEAMEGSRAAAIHSRSKLALSHSLRGYAEKAVPNCPNGMGATLFTGGRFVPDGLLSEYTARGNYLGLGGPVHGYRASVAGPTLIASVVCQCSEKDWPKLEPAFRRVIGSIHEAGKAAPQGLQVPGAGGSLPTSL